jgi:hypothetical protein
MSLISLSVTVRAGNKIKVYFNKPVDTSVATWENAVYSTNISDTIVAYIDRAKYTIDVAMYNFSFSNSFADIAGAMNAALNRGVQIRWIYDGSSSNSGLTHLDPSIPTLGSPTSQAYGIMHNKVMIIDANSADPNDAVVYTGSMNWTAQQFNTDYNNVLFIQDSALAHAYTNEFNLMWGSTGLMPDSANAKFGPDKIDLGQHSFMIDSHQVNLYFSPSDNTNTQLLNTISTANTDFYFGMYGFTYQADANAIMARKNAGVYVAGIDDAFSDNYSPYNTFTSGLGSNFISYHGTGLYHNKYMIVDPSDECSDPIVETGSHNWSSSANTVNDENTLIIHSDTVANVYYQYFYGNFVAFGGTLTPQLGCGLAVKQASGNNNSVSVYPNPFSSSSAIEYTLSVPAQVSLTVTNLYGQVVAVPVNNELTQPGTYHYDFAPRAAGVYFVYSIIGNQSQTLKLVKVD